MNWYRWDGADLVLTVRVQPRAGTDEIAGLHDGALRVRLTAPPVDDKANTALLRRFADDFGVHRASVHLEQGATNRSKRLRILAPTREPSWFGALGGVWPAGPSGDGPR